MSGLLDTNALQGIFGSVLGAIYGDGTLIRVEMVRQPGGVLLPTETPYECKVQVDACTEAMRQQPGYTETDVRLLILQDGFAGGQPTSDDIVVVRGERWKLFGITQDPARAYWECRGVMDASEEAED